MPEYSRKPPVSAFPGGGTAAPGRAGPAASPAGGCLCLPCQPASISGCRSRRAAVSYSRAVATRYWHASHVAPEQSAQFAATSRLPAAASLLPDLDFLHTWAG